VLSGTEDRSRIRLSWATLASALLHLLFLTLIFYAARLIFTNAGAKEKMSQTTVITIEQRRPIVTLPTPQPHRVVKQIQHPVAAPPAAITPRHEIARQVAKAASQPPPPHHHPTVASQVALDEAGYAKEVATLNKGDDPHAIPTIDPSTRGSSMKSYAFNPGQSNDGSDHGNGIITPTQSWHDHGMDCYYGRYEYTYPDGAEEDGNIAWPFCYPPDSDPFKGPPHLMPFPDPLPGYSLPPGTELPPLEKQFYQQWAASSGAGN
jgi:hypothetical protein